MSLLLLRMGAAGRHHDPAPPPWSPADDPALEQWLRGDLGLTLVDGAVSVQADQSGHGRDISQGSAALRPVPQARLGQQALRYTRSASQHMSSAAFDPALVQPWSTLVVVELATDTATQAVHDGASEGARAVLRWGSSGWEASAGGAGGSFVVGSNDETLKIHAVSAPSATLSIYNGDLETAANSGTSGSTGVGSVRVGEHASVSVGHFLDGWHAEHILRSAALDSETRALYAAYFAARYTL